MRSTTHTRFDFSALVILPLAVLTLDPAQAATLEVGPGKEYSVPSAAIAAANAGDTIEIAAGTYENDYAIVRTNGLKLVGVGGMAVLNSHGMIPNGKAIWVVQGDDIVIENVEFCGARVRDRNGAGIRQEGKNLTLRHCGFFDNENGILGGSGDSVIDIQHCEFAFNSLVARPGTHNLYIGRAKKLIFKFNYSHHAKVAHLLKSRAEENMIAYNRIADESDGSSSYVVNVPNGGKCMIIGNILHQGPKCQNRVIVAYGEEGVSGDKNGLYFINNTVMNDCELGSPTFVQVRNLPNDAPVVLRNNIFAGKGRVTNWHTALLHANFNGPVREVEFVDRDSWDLAPAADSPCVDAGVSPGKTSDGEDLMPTFQYVHPITHQRRPVDRRIDIGAIERG